MEYYVNEDFFVCLFCCCCCCCCCLFFVSFVNFFPFSRSVIKWAKKYDIIKTKELLHILREREREKALGLGVKQERRSSRKRSSFAILVAWLRPAAVWNHYLSRLSKTDLLTVGDIQVSVVLSLWGAHDVTWASRAPIIPFVCSVWQYSRRSCLPTTYNFCIIINT